MPLHPRVAAPIVLLLALALAAQPAPAAGAPPDPALAAAVAARLDGLAGPGSAPITAEVRAVAGWSFGTTVRPSPGEHVAPLSYLFLAERAAGGWAVALEPEPAFRRMLRRAPRGLVSEEERGVLGGATLAAGGEALLSLPYAPGESWYLTGGPHPSGFDGGGAWSALDFAGGSGVVRAARDGVAYVPCANLVKVYHPDGFQTGYYHLADIQVLNGQPVARGAALGRISSGVGCGGQAYGDHLHFWLMQGGADRALQGTAIGGWAVQNGAAPYQGCMTKAGSTQCAGAGRILNDGAVGDGAASALELANPSFESGESPAPWGPNGPCAPAAPSDPQGAYAGERYLAVSSASADCLSIAQDIAGVPLAGETYRLAVWARSADTTVRSATLALWALGTSPRAASVDFALAGDRWRCYEVALPIDSAGYGGLRAELYLHTADGGAYHVDAAALGRGPSPLCPPAERYRAAVAGLDYPGELEPGATAEIALTLRNTGSSTWDEGTTVAPLPRDTPPALASSSWPEGGTRIAAIPGVTPGAEQTVRFTVRAPDEPGVYTLNLGLVQEGITWFAEPGEGSALVIITVGDPPVVEPPGPERLYLPLLIQ